MLSGAELQGATLIGTKLDQAQLQSVTTTEEGGKTVSIDAANLNGCDCAGATFVGTDVTGISMMVHFNKDPTFTLFAAPAKRPPTVVSTSWVAKALCREVAGVHLKRLLEAR